MYERFVSSLRQEENSDEDNSFIKQMSDIIPIKDLKHVALTKIPNYGTMPARTNLFKDIGVGMIVLF